MVYIADGSVQKNLNTKIIASQKIAYPNNSLIIKYTEIVEPFFDKMRDNTKESIKISQIRDSLLPKLMSGKIRVKC